MQSKPTVFDGQSIRREQRFPTRTLLVDAPIAGRVVNVSERGISIESREKVRVGANYLFRVRNTRKALSVPGRVEWCRLTGTRPDDWGEPEAVYQAGISLAESVSTRAWQAALVRLSERRPVVA